MKPAITALQDTYMYVSISCGSDVRRLADEYNGSLYAAHQAAQEGDEGTWAELDPKTSVVRPELWRAMRAELGVED